MGEIAADRSFEDAGKGRVEKAERVSLSPEFEGAASHQKLGWDEMGGESADIVSMQKGNQQFEVELADGTAAVVVAVVG